MGIFVDLHELIKSMGYGKNERDVTPCPALFANGSFDGDFSPLSGEMGSKSGRDATQMWGRGV
jgi:hypothetical protein